MGVEIQLGEYRVTSDTYNWILQKGRVVQDGKNKGKTQYDNIAYYSNINALIKSLVDRKMRTSNARTVQELIGTVKLVENLYDKIPSNILPK